MAEAVYTITNDGAGNSRLVIPMCDRCAAVTPPDQMMNHPLDEIGGTCKLRRVCIKCYIDLLDAVVKARLEARR